MSVCVNKFIFSRGANKTGLIGSFLYYICIRNEGELKEQAKKGKATLLMHFKGRLNGKNYKEFAEMQIGG